MQPSHLIVLHASKVPLIIICLWLLAMTKIEEGGAVFEEFGFFTSFEDVVDGLDSGSNGSAD